MFIVFSCKKNEEVIHEYQGGFFDTSEKGVNERYFISSTYKDAFEYAGLLNNGRSYYSMLSASRDKVLWACRAAEETIRDANYDFKGYYVFEVKEDGERIYFKTYGKKYQE